MRILKGNFRRDGKPARTSGAKLSKIKIEIKLFKSQNDLIHEKYLKLMRNPSFRLITIFNVNGVKCKRHPIYDMYAASNFGKIIHVKKQNQYWCSSQYGIFEMSS